ncbi:tellurite resistance TerB family protein [Zhongshania arctica]|uniref:Tellurite resistance TerB family protein n=1 Tax=Zhongshania arctica TaxID=3238302 RepID=A0ABV3TSS1_9GAMM
MNLQTLLQQFMGPGQAQEPTSFGQGSPLGQAKEGIGQLASGLPGGLAGGAAAGGLVALLVGNKKARKFAGKAATVGGAALLGGVAYSAFKNWKQSSSQTHSAPQALASISQSSFEATAAINDNFQLTLIKAMIAAARADSEIDSKEQDKIFDAVDKIQLAPEMKSQVFDLLRKPPTIEELVRETNTLEQKTEVYLISCFAIDVDHPSEREYLSQLEQALRLPAGLAQHLEQQSAVSLA